MCLTTVEDQFAIDPLPCFRGDRDALTDSMMPPAHNQMIPPGRGSCFGLGPSSSQAHAAAQLALDRDGSARQRGLSMRKARPQEEDGPGNRGHRPALTSLLGD